MISIFFSQSLTRDLKKLLEATKQIAKGNFNVDVQIRAQDEVGALANGFKIMASEVDRQSKELEAYSKKTDTGLDWEIIVQKAMLNLLKKDLFL